MSTRSSAPRGVLMAGVGAFVALASLWLPWYTIKFPQSFRDALSNVGSGGSGSGGSTAGGAGEAFAGLFKGLAAVLPTEITGKGWQVMSGGDVALAIAAGAALLLVLAVGGGFSGVRIANGVAGRLIALAGLVVAAIALYHVVSKPGAGAGSFSSIVTVKLGIWVATAGGLSMIVGGLLTARPPQVAAAELALTPSAFDPPAAAVEPDPFAAPASEAAVADDPVAAPAPAAEATFDAVAARTRSATPDPFSAPDPVEDSYVRPDPSPAPAEESFAKPEPYPVPDRYAEPDPFAAPAEESYPKPEPYPVPDPYAKPDPFAAPADSPVTAESEPYPAFTEPSTPSPLDPVADSSDAATAVPDWSGFSTPTPSADPELEPEPAAGSSAVPAASEARPAGVSIAPPGWTGA